MNIEQAKTQIKNAMLAYFTKNEFGEYKIPIEKQRPVLLIGPPGIGKTAIMEQVASELGVGLVSYSMTHHTRQSALGLPFITEREFEGYKYSVSEYTMSEIIGSIYALMEETDVREGILFLDEINCVSETLAPCMLQFLQYKVFGQHQIPKGWIVVTAGNPPEYNKSVRDFDIVTWDRLKRIDVEPDYDVWKNYAASKGVHPAVLTYLASRKKDFYMVESTADGKHFVTARGWDDMSEMIKLYEENDLTVDEMLISQYIQTPKIAKDFAIYYDLFTKYKSDYKIEEILAGDLSEDILFRAQRAPLDERLSVLGILFDAVTGMLREVCEKEDALDILMPVLKSSKAGFAAGEKPEVILSGLIAEQEEMLRKGTKASALSPGRQRAVKRTIAALEGFRKNVITRRETGGEEAFEIVRKGFEAIVDDLKASVKEGKAALGNAFSFCERAFETENESASAERKPGGKISGDEILIFVTELTVNYYTARFIGHYGCEKYYMHNKELQFAQRQAELTERIEQFNWEI